MKMTRAALILFAAFAMSGISILSCASPQNPLVEEALDRGDEFFEAGRFQDAISEYTKAIEIDPWDAIAYNNRGVAHYEYGSHDKAIADYDKAIDLDSNLAIAYFNRGNTYLGGYQDGLSVYDRAIQDYSKAISLEPGNASFYFKRGVAYHFRDARHLGMHQSNVLSEAIEDYDKTISIDPNFVDAYVNRGVAYHMNDDVGRWHNTTIAIATIADFDKAISLLQDSSLTYHNPGIPPRLPDMAVEDISRIHFAKGVIHRRVGNMAAMRSDAEKAIELGFNPSLIPASELGGYNLLWMIMSEKDIAIFHHTRALARLKQADYDNAVADMDKARRLIPTHIRHLHSDDMRDVYFQSGVAYYDAGSYDDAIILFDKAIDLVASPSEYPAAYYQRGMAHYRNGSHREAIANFDRLIGLEQDFPDAARYRRLAQDRLPR